jgi:RND family efflux transporter MFP subunit
MVPAPAGDELSAITHVDSARVLQAEALLTVPLLHDGQTTGALLLERRSGPPFDEDTQRIAGAAGVMLGPVWALQRAAERPWQAQLRDTAQDALHAFLGPRYPGLKLAGLVLGSLLLMGALIPIDHRVAARTVVEGATQRAAVAPFDGFIAESLARAGDSVRAGQPLARLDERDLTLERDRWSAEHGELTRKYQVAMSQGDLSAMGVIGAQIAQSEAQLALAQERLARATLLAPFDGLIVSGDLSQSIGMPVQQGTLLFEVAPLEGYRVILQVDDRDIARLARGQRGELVLSSLPDRSLPFTVSTVTPVATQVDGRNVFRVEAMVDGEVERLRPGMEGVGKVVVGQRSAIWVWTHSVFDWLRLALWNWLP